MGVTECRLLRQIKLPVIPTSAHVRWAVQLSLLHYADQSYVEWAERWLSGEDRTREAASRAVVLAPNAATEPAETAAGLAAWAAELAAERAAWSAARKAAGSAAWAAVEEAESAAWASLAAEDILPLTEILEQAISDETFEKEEV
jgi:predicted nucleic acid-binding protein